MSAMTDYFEQVLLGHAFHGSAWTAPGTTYVGAFTANPSDTGGGTEVSAGGYARAAMVAGTAVWTAPGVSGTISNVSVVNLGTATADWGTITAAGVWNAVSAGTLLIWGTLAATKVVGSGDVFQFDAGALDLSFA